LFKDEESKKALEYAKKSLFSSEEQYALLQDAMSIAAMKVAMMRPVLKLEEEPNDDNLVSALADVIELSNLEEESK
jgi:hypothetical protein